MKLHSLALAALVAFAGQSFAQTTSTPPAQAQAPSKEQIRANKDQVQKDMEAASELSKLRTVKLRDFAKKGSAEYYILMNSEGSVEDVRKISGDATLKAAEEHLRSAKYDAYFPPDSKVKVVRRSMVVCSEIASVGCNAVLLIPDTVTDVN